MTDERLPDSDHLVRDCWCHPRITQVCPDCDGDGCWKCDEGLVPEYDPDLPIITIHSEIKDAR